MKRGWAETTIPSAILPSLTPIWEVVVALGLLAAFAFRREDEQASYSAP